MFERTQHFAIMLFFLEIDSTEGCGSADATTGAIVRQKKEFYLFIFLVLIHLTLSGGFCVFGYRSDSILPIENVFLNWIEFFVVFDTIC